MHDSGPEAETDELLTDPEPAPADQAVENFDRLLSSARRIANRLELDSRVLDHLYSHSRFDSLSRQDWEAEVRLALAVDRRTRQVLKNASPAILDVWMDQAAKEQALESFRSTSGTLVLAFHGGFAELVRTFFRRSFPQGVMISAQTSGDDVGNALFAARNALLEGNGAFVSPEGGYGRQSTTIDVLGCTRGVADGAPFLAHTTGCKTVWLTMTRPDEKFVPVVVEGPKVEEKEPFRSYRERFFAFYREQIENALSGDPRNLALLKNWSRSFEMMLAGRGQRWRTKKRVPTGK